VGRSPVATAARALGLAIDEESSAQTLARDGLKPTLILETASSLKPGAVQNIVDSYRKLVGGPHNAGTPIVLQDGLKAQPWNFSAADAQFLESRRLSAEDSARIFGVSPQSVGLTDSVSYGSAAQAAQDLVTNTLNPLAARIEQALERALMSNASRSELFVEFDLSGLLRADPTARWATYRIGRETGALSPNDIRKFENMSPIDGGDEYTRPLNTAPLGTAPTDGGAS